MIIEVQDFCFFYESKQALFNIDLQIPEKKITAFIGPSGCGKSTFLRSINRMNDLIEGTRMTGQLLFWSKQVTQYPTIELRMRIGMVFQKPNPFSMSIFDNVVYGLRIHGIKKKSILQEKAEKSLKHAALWDEVKDSLHKSAFGLSGGQQQRLCLARTLAVEPEVILLDEPTSALDPGSTRYVESVLTQLKDHYTIVIVTHNMQQASRISQQTAFFLNGRLEESGKTQDIFVKPQKKTTEDYISGRFG